jgi:GNAT superfamily N-acetyltransferase
MCDQVRFSWTEDPGDPVVLYAAELATSYWREVLGPEEPEYPAAELAWDLMAAQGVVRSRLGLAHRGSKLVGAVVQRLPLHQLRSSWLPWLIVDRAYRRRGVGRGLLQGAISEAVKDGRTRLGWRSPVHSAAATAFSIAAGGHQDESLEQNRLMTAEIHLQPGKAWLDQSTEPLDGYELVGWDGPCPLELVSEFAGLQRAMEDAPGNDPTAALKVTVANVRAAENRWLPRGPYWRLCARQASTGRLVAFTEMQLPASRPWLAEQGDTGVLPNYRGLGLGTWLKASNAVRLLHERPEVRVVETWNSSSNAPMLAINRALGFRSVGSWRRWALAL